MTVSKQPSEGSKTATSPGTDPSHSSLNQATSATATSTLRDSAFASKTRPKVRGSADDDGAVPVIQSTSTKTSMDKDNKKENSKLQHASVTRPFAPTMFASIPNESTLPDRNLASKTQVRNPEGDGSVPGAIPVFPKENTRPTSDLEDREQTSLTVADNDTATQNEIHIPRAFSVDDTPCYAEAYVTNDVENGDPSTKTEPPKPCTPAMRYGAIAGILVVIALVVTLLVMFAVKPPSAAKAQFVQYSADWAAGLPPNFSPSAVISDLELTCLASGILKLPVIRSKLAIQPVCTQTSFSTIRCAQRPFQQTDSVVVVDSSILFQCHGTSPDQLVGQATLFDISVGGFSGTRNVASQFVDLFAVDVTTGSPEADRECSDDLLIIPNTSDVTNSTSMLLCGYYDSCVSDGVNECFIFLEGRSMQQRSPVKSKHIRDE